MGSGPRVQQGDGVRQGRYLLPVPDSLTPSGIPRVEVMRATPDHGDLALVLTGGGARGAYQVGLLRYLARRFPDLRIPIITGVSAGAVNAAYLANHRGTFEEAVAQLTELWCSLTPDQVFRVDAPSIFWNMTRWMARLAFGGLGGEPRTRGLVDTKPLRHFLNRALQHRAGELRGIEYNIRRGALRAIALTATDYATMSSVTWVQGRDIVTWERPKRRSLRTYLKIDHVMASSALPFFFPAVDVDGAWHGDGGVRLTAPLSPALHLGAHKILAVSPRYEQSIEEANRPVTRGYPPPAQVLGVLYNAIFLDLIDQDVIRLERMNELLRRMSPEQRGGMRVVDILVVRPSRDLGRIAAEYEVKLPRMFRYFTRSWGTRQTASPDLLSLILFQGDYIRRIIEIGEADAEARADELCAFVTGRPALSVER
jgi:NTE family protein